MCRARGFGVLKQPDRLLGAMPGDRFSADASPYGVQVFELRRSEEQSDKLRTRRSAR